MRKPAHQPSLNIGYREDVVSQRAREDAAHNLPHPALADCSPFEQELKFAYAQWANEDVRACEQKLQPLDAEIKTVEAEAHAAHAAETKKIEITHEAEHLKVETGRDVADKRDLHDRLKAQIDNLIAKFNRPPSVSLPHWAYLILAIIIALGEVPLNAQVFGMFGESQLMTWVMSIMIAGSLPLAGHFVGMKIKQHGLGFSWPNAVKAAVATLIVFVALYAINNIRLSYMASLDGITEGELAGAYYFLYINLLVFAVSALLSYLAHDSIPGYEEQYRKWVAAQRRLKKAEALQAKQLAVLARRREESLHAAAVVRDKKLAGAMRLKGEYDRVLREGQLAERHWLVGLSRSVGIYRQTNLVNRPDSLRPASFDLSLSFDLQLAHYREKLDNHA